MTVNLSGWPNKVLKALSVGYAVLFNIWLALSFGGMSWESFHPSYRLPQVAAGLKFATLATAFSALAFGLAFGRRWTRWTSIVLGILGCCLSVVLFWDGYLRVKPAYSGEESSEVFMAIVLSSASLCVLGALSLPAGRSYFDSSERQRSIYQSES
jgi:hypothetical protein